MLPILRHTACQEGCSSKDAAAPTKVIAPQICCAVL